MADYTLSKPIEGKISPEDAVDSSWGREEPLITPQQLRDRILFGVNLKVAATRQEMTDEILQEYILDAVALLEEEIGIDIFPTQHSERQAFDRNEYHMQGYMRLRHRPVQSIEALSVVTSNDQVIWTIDNSWVDIGYLSKGLVYIVPINVALAPASSGGSPAGAAAFLAILGMQPWVPAFWKVHYTTGWVNGKLPRQLNYLIGVQTGIQVLTKLAQANAKFNSKSLSIDGLSQSSSNAGGQIYDSALNELKEIKKTLVKKFKARLGLNLFSSNV